MAYDDTLEEQLRTILAAKAEDVDRAPAWEGAGPRPAGRAALVMRRWRAPVLAAAAVAVIAVVTAAIVTHGFQGDRAAAPGGADPAPVTVPITCSFTIAENAAGSANHASSTAVASEQTGDCASPGTIELSVRGTLPEAIIGWKLVIDGATTGGSEVRSDGAPLGLMTFPGVIEGYRYLWSAVGPDIAQVQLQALQGDTDVLDPGFTSTRSAAWTIDSGDGTAFSLPDPDTVVWTEIESGWHAFALKLPDDTRLLDVTALRADGAVAQLVQYQVTEGSVMPIDAEATSTVLATPTALPTTTALAPTTTASGVGTSTTDAASSTDTEPDGPDTGTTNSETPDDSEEPETRDPDVPASREKVCQLWWKDAFYGGPGELLAHHLAGKAVPMDDIRAMTLDSQAAKTKPDDPELTGRIDRWNDEVHRLQRLPEEDWTWDEVDSLAAAYSGVNEICGAY